MKTLRDEIPKTTLFFFDVLCYVDEIVYNLTFRFWFPGLGVAYMTKWLETHDW